MTSALVTKSVRLRAEESEELARLSQATLVSEAALMKQWIQEGIQAKKLELAIQAYIDRETDLRGAAAMAGVSFNRFMREAQSRNIVVLDDDGLLDQLTFLAETFDSQELRSAIGRVRMSDSGLTGSEMSHV